MAKKVIVYSTPTCPYCIRLKKFLDEGDIAYENKDVSSDEAAKKEMVDKSKQMGVPVVDIEGDIIVGFDKDRISAALGN
jgi:glutaredoxin-like YruB-family protein